jgi:hypothetical protein
MIDYLMFDYDFNAVLRAAGYPPLSSTEAEVVD